MRASRLFELAHLDVRLPKEERRTIDPLIVLLVDDDESVDASSDVIQPKMARGITVPMPPPGWNPVHLPTDFPMPPPGWKPGDPVVLPTGLPMPPPGWKPGDPVQLPAQVVPQPTVTVTVMKDSDSDESSRSEDDDTDCSSSMGAIKPQPQRIAVPSVVAKPGMPLKLPTHVPVPPPGWKPGNHVQFPTDIPIPSSHGLKHGNPGSLIPRPIRMPQPARVVPQPTIRVPHVQLDIIHTGDTDSDTETSGSEDDDDDDVDAEK